MYAVAIFALALLSPLPFISPFDYIMQDATAQSSTQNVPLPEFADIVTPSPFGATPVYKPRTVTPFEIDDFSYAVITGDGNSSTLLSIANITNPNSPSVMSYSNTSSGLGNIFYSHVFTINDSTYVMVSDNAADSVGIINISNPSSPVHLVNTSNGEYPKLDNPRGITTTTIGSSTYALVTSFNGKGIQIINVTDPSKPSPVYYITDDADGYDYPKLKGAWSVTTTTIGSSIYALATAYSDSGVQIINITDPNLPLPVADITNGTEYPMLNGPRALTTVTLDSFTYALVVDFVGNGVQIINITEPNLPSPVANIVHGEEYLTLNGSRGITTVTLGPFTYALVTAFRDHGVQIINITDPASPSPVTSITHNAADYAKLRGAYGIATTTINSSLYALVASYHTGMQIIGLDHGFISAYTSNQNPKYAKAGDTLIINFNASGTIASHTSQILGLNANAIVNGAVYNATVTVPSTLREAYATFMINVTNTQGTNATITESDISLSNVFIDTISPSIELIGSADYTILPGTPISSIPNVTVSDGDPNYVENFTLVVNDTVDTTRIGDVYNYTYTAYPDLAGNPGSSTSRIVTVIDDRPIVITSLNITSNGASNNFANAGKNITVILVTDSTDLGNFTGDLFGKPFTAMTSNGNANFTATVSSNDVNGNVTFLINATNSDGRHVTMTHDDITNKSLFVTIDTVSPTIILIGMNNTNVSLGDSYTDLGAIASDSTYANNITVNGTGSVNTSLTGVYTFNYTAPEDMAGNLGSTIYRIVNVLDVPPFELRSNLVVSPFGDMVNGMNGIGPISLPLNINTFKIGNYTYTWVYSDLGVSNSVIINITDPSSPSQVSVLDISEIDDLFVISDAAYAVIDGFTYAIATSEINDRVLIINVSNVSDPYVVTYVTDDDNGNYTELSGAHGIAIVTHNSSTYAIVASFSDSGVQIIDITNPSHPAPVYAIADDDDGYTKLGGAISITTVKIGASTFALVAAYASGDSGVQIIDITDPSDPDPVSTIGFGRLDGSFDVTTVTIESSTFALVTLHYGNEVAIIDITNPYYPNTVSLVRDGSIYSVLDGARSITTTTIGSSTYALVTALDDDGIQIIDITDPHNPAPVYAITDDMDGYNTLNQPFDITTVTIDTSTYALVTASYDHGVQIIKLEPEYISAYTNNQNSKYAKAGDTLTINFTASDTIASHTSQILGLGTTATVNDAAYNAAVIVPSTPMESYITFTTQIVNTNGTSATITENDISSKNNIFVDTISPSIELVGPADYVIPYGTFDPFIPNVTVSDGDPNYVENFTLVKNVTVNTTIIGSVYNYTYTANTDPAGNLGSSTSRIITVMEPSFEIRPNLVASPAGTIENGTDGFYSIVHPEKINTFKIGNSIYAGVHSDSATNSFTIVNITDINSPSLAFVLNTTVNSLYTITDATYTVIDGSTYAIAISEDDDRVLIINVSNPYSPSPVTNVTDGANYKLNTPLDVTTVKIDSSTYALVAASADNSVQIINITDPLNPTPASNITDGMNNYTALAGARSITTVTLGASTYALVVTYNDGTQIIDITDPFNPSPVSALIYDYPTVYRANSITTVTLGALTYALVASPDHGVQIIDITDPSNPVPISAITDNGGNRALGFPQSITTVTLGTSTYALVASVWEDGVQIIDVSDPYHPPPLSAINDGVGGYTELDYAYSITTVTIDTSTYALVTASYDDGVQIIKLEPEYISAYTNNQNSKYAKSGDTLDIKLLASDTIASHTSQILELDATATVKDTVYNTAVTIQPTPRESYATFTINVTNTQGTSVTITQDDISPKSNVFVDTISPRIELVGSADYIVLPGTLDPFIPNVTVSDGDPNYSGNFTLVKNATVNTTMIGSTYKYTYIADSDTAGNLGTNTSRIITVVDVAHINPTSLNITSNGASSNFANAGKNITVTLVTDGTDHGNFTGNLFGKPFTFTTTGNTTKFTSTVSSNDTNGNVTFLITATNSSGNHAILTDADLTNTNSFVTIDTISPTITLNGTNNIIVYLGYSYTDPGAIALDSTYTNGTLTVHSMGSVNTSQTGVYTLNYTAPDDMAGNPGSTIYRTVNVVDIPLFEIRPNLVASPAGTIENGTNGFYSIGQLGKINTFKIGNSTYAGVHAAPYLHPFTIVNITDPSSPSPVYVLDPAVSNLYTIPNAAYIAINGSTYAITAPSFDYSGHILNVSDPSLTSLVSSLPENYFGHSYPSSYDITTVTINTSVFAIMAAYFPGTLDIINITSPSSPVLASTIVESMEYPKLSDPRSITTVTLDTSTFVLSEGYNGYLNIINITDPYNPILASDITYDGYDQYTAGGPHSMTTITLGTSTYALVASHENGLHIIDVTDPFNPAQISAIANDGEYATLYGARSITTVTLGTSTFALVVASIQYVADPNRGVQIIDVTDPFNPTPVSNITSDVGGDDSLYDLYSITTVTIGSSTYALVTSFEDNGIQIIKLEPEYMSVYTNNQNPKYAKAGDTLYIKLLTSDTIASHTSEILGLDTTATVKGTVYNTTVTIQSTPMESYATFNITVANANDTSITMNENNISLSNVFIDTISPTINLIGPADYTILSGTPTSSIPNVTVSDGDPNYSGNFTIIKNATVDTAMIGSAYNYTYIADSDTAGNLGANVSRIITVIDVNLIPIVSLNITSNGALNNFANAGKNITVTLVTDSTDLGNFTGTLLGRDIVKEDVNNGIAEFTVTVLPNDPNGNVTFSITAINSSGNNVTFTHDDITNKSSFVTIDTIPPSIKLIGSADYTVPYGTSNPFIPNVTVSDGDPNYVSNFTLVKSAPVNTTIIGSVYKYTYTAGPDTAGNLGSNTSRIITVIDADSINITSLNITSNGASSNFANAGKNITVTLVTDSTDLIHFAGNLFGKPFTAMTANGIANFTAIVSSDDTNGNVTFSINVTNSSGNHVTFTHDNITNKSSFVIIDTISPTIALNGINDIIVSLGDSYTDLHATASDSTYENNITVRGIGSVNTSRIGVYTFDYTAPEDMAGNPGSIISRTVHVLDVPSFEIMSNLAISSFGVIQNGMNDFDSIMKPEKINTFKIGNSTYAGVYSDQTFFDSFTIINITDPSSPSPAFVLDPTVNSMYTITDAAYTVIDGSTYAIAISERDDRVLIINVSNPYIPSLVTNVTDGANYNLNAPLDVTTVTLDSSTYALVAAYASNGVQIINITDPELPSPVSSITNGEDYRMLNGPQAITTITLDSFTYALVAATIGNGVQIINITDPYKPTPASAITNGEDDYTELHGSYDITTVKIDTSAFALVAGRYGQGIQIINITDPYKPTAASAVNDSIGDFTELFNVASITTATIGTSTLALSAAYHDDGVQIINITDPYNPTNVLAIDNDANHDTKLDGATSITTVTIDSAIFALVAASDDNAIQIIKLDPGFISTYSSNQNPKYAKQGDTLDINFTASDIIASYTSQILELDANANTTVNGAVYNVIVTVPSEQRESYATFTIQIVNIHGTSATITKNYISPTSNVFIDTIPPTIKLVGPADYVVPYGSNPSIPNVIVSDGDPNYSGNFTLDKNATVDTTIMGSAYKYTYTADSDTAGNLGDSISRIITIGTKPITVTSLSITSSSGNNFANASKNITVTLETDSTDLGNFTGNLFGKPFTAMASNGNANFTTTVSSDDPNGKVTFSINATNSDGSHVAVTHNDLTNKSSFVIIDTISPTIALNGIDYVVIPTGDSYTDLGAIASDSTFVDDIMVDSTDSVNTNIEGTYILDYTAPSDMAGNPGSTISRTVAVFDTPPLELVRNLITSSPGSIENGMDGFDSIMKLKKINTFKIDDSLYAGVHSDSKTHSFTIVNITDINSPRPAFVLDPTVNSMYTITDAAYAVINGSTYAIAISERDNRVLIINVSNPYSPSPVTNVTNGANYKLDDPSDIATVTIDTSTYALVTANTSDSVQIINITDPLNPTPASNITDDNDGYTKLDGARFITTVTIDTSTYALVAAYDDFGVQIINITDPYNPTSASAITDGKDNYAELYGASSITTVTIGTSTYALVAAYDDFGVQIIDITDPYNPAPVSNITNGGDYTALSYAIDITTVKFNESTFALVVSEFSNGVQIIDITDPYAPTPVVAIFDSAGDGFNRLRNPTSVVIATIDESTYALVATHDDNAVQIIKIDPDFISAYSSNQNPKYAKQGDTLGINFTVNDIIVFHTGEILELDADANAIINGAMYNATVTVPSESRESYATFTIQVATNHGTTETITESNIFSNNVFVDTISPRIKLDGPADYFILKDASEHFIPGVIVSDGDPRYSGGFTLVKSATVDTTIIGSVYEYTYTANTDSSGNVGDSVTRTIFVVDNLPSTSCMDSELSYNIIIGNDPSKMLNGTADNDIIFGTGGDDIINGLGGNDCIYGNGGNDVIDGGDGNDMIDGGDGNDMIDGGDGDDRIQGGYGLDEINGNAGNDNLYGNDDNDTINGGIGDDSIDGGLHDDMINGGEGSDLIHGNDGFDIINGSSGNDNLYGGEDIDTIYGGEGDDTIHGGPSDDTLHGEGGNDVIHGNLNHDTIYGGDGDDIIDGGRQNDIIDGGAGNDRIKGSYGNDEINGSAGNDDIFGDANNDQLRGGDGDDRIYGGGGNDVIHGDMGNDIIIGRDGNDVIYGNDGHDVIQGDAGHDILTGGGGNDLIYGGYGLDMINGSAGNDKLFGGGSNDTINGNDGNDDVTGGSGNDTINGNDGNDDLKGESGYDTITGGNGNDTIDGGYAADIIRGGDGDDVIYDDKKDDIDGGSGNNTLV